MGSDAPPAPPAAAAPAAPAAPAPVDFSQNLSDDMFPAPSAPASDDFVVVSFNEGGAQSVPPTQQCEALPDTLPQSSEKPTIPPAADAAAASAVSGAAVPEGLTLKCVPEYNQMHVGECSLLSMIDITAPAADLSEQKRAPVEICAVIDRSGSMRVKKLALVLKSLEFVVRELLPQDKLSIVAFDHTVKRVLPMTQMTIANKKKTLELLKSIKPGGSTFLSGGLLAGMKEMREAGKKAAPTTSGRTVSKSVWLFTDGQATTGIKTTDGLLEEVNVFLGESTDMTLFTFGFGDTHNEEMLRAVAEAGSGMYYYLRDPAEIPACFAECLGGLLTVVASDVTVTFTPSRGVKVTSLPENKDASLDNIRITYKDMYGEESRNIIMDLKIDQVSAPTTQIVGCVKVTWRGANGNTREAESTLCVDRVIEYDSDDRTPDPDVLVHRLRLDAADAMVRARELADVGDLFGANEVVQKMRTVSSRMTEQLQAQEAKAPSASLSTACKKKQAKRHAIVTSLCDDAVEIQSRMATTTEWAQSGRKAMMNAEMGHRKQRAAKGKSSAYSVAAQECLLDRVKSLS
eukprot:TRINITY_DN73255_c0_g1_i1.p1 TRINITY_DN73255_c0_g1~~TRINITY_DN73255_c0_g1_i1.p1  ORF type:complete len:611 (+),score=202.42 TRINITY_DN73255_c0_g1_i1:116-1834(+)